MPLLPSELRVQGIQLENSLRSCERDLGPHTGSQPTQFRAPGADQRISFLLEVG